MQDPSTKKEEAVTAAENNINELIPEQPAAQSADSMEEDPDYLFFDEEGGEG